MKFKCILFSLFFSIQFSYADEVVVDLERLQQAVLDKISETPELEFMRKLAEEIGVRIYLQGNSAAQLTYHAKLKAADPDYDGTEDAAFIFERTSLSIIVDGSNAKVAELAGLFEESLNELGWIGKDVQLVSLEDFRINNPQPGSLYLSEMLKRHRDTVTWGLVNLNAKTPGQVFKDLDAFHKVRSVFGQNFAEGIIDFVFSDQHEKSVAFREGKAPKIIFMARFLQNALTYNLKIEREELLAIRTLVQEYEGVKRDRLSFYAKTVLVQVVMSALLNAPDHELAWDILDATGLRKLAIELDGNRIYQAESPSWWLHKEPLRRRSTPSVDSGRTAAEIFGTDEIIITHTTQTYTALSNISRSYGIEGSHPNFFISRVGVEGETAAYGDGVYGAVGYRGHSSGEYDIYMKLNPEAREGVDFTLHEGLIVLKERQAVTFLHDPRKAYTNTPRVVTVKEMNEQPLLVEKLVSRGAALNTCEIILHQ